MKTPRMASAENLGKLMLTYLVMLLSITVLVTGLHCNSDIHHPYVSIALSLIIIVLTIVSFVVIVKLK